MTMAISIIASFVATYIAASLAYKNNKRARYDEEKKKIYYELAEILPIVDDFKCQSDYLDGSEGSGRAPHKIRIMEIQLEDAKKRLTRLESEGKDCYRIEEARVDVSNLEYKIEKHKEYLQVFAELFNKIESFERGRKNLLRLFASPDVWNSYICFTVALSNEYNTSIGVTADDIKFHINNLIGAMRKDLK